MALDVAWIWAVFGLVLLLGELLSPGIYLLWLGLAALIVAAVTGVADLSLQGQLAVFIASSLGTCLAGWFAYRRQYRPVGASAADALNETSSQMVGATGEIVEAAVAGGGKVKIGDSVWLAAGASLPVGTVVRVVAQNGTILRVERLDPG